MPSQIKLTCSRFFSEEDKNSHQILSYLLLVHSLTLSYSSDKLKAFKLEIDELNRIARDAHQKIISKDVVMQKLSRIDFEKLDARNQLRVFLDQIFLVLLVAFFSFHVGMNGLVYLKNRITSNEEGVQDTLKEGRYLKSLVNFSVYSLFGSQGLKKIVIDMASDEKMFEMKLK